MKFISFFFLSYLKSNTFDRNWLSRCSHILSLFIFHFVLMFVIECRALCFYSVFLYFGILSEWSNVLRLSFRCQSSITVFIKIFLFSVVHVFVWKLLQLKAKEKEKKEMMQEEKAPSRTNQKPSAFFLHFVYEHYCCSKYEAITYKLHVRCFFRTLCHSSSFNFCSGRWCSTFYHLCWFFFLLSSFPALRTFTSVYLFLLVLLPIFYLIRFFFSLILLVVAIVWVGNKNESSKWKSENYSNWRKRERMVLQATKKLSTHIRHIWVEEKKNCISCFRDADSADSPHIGINVYISAVPVHCHLSMAPQKIFAYWNVMVFH